MVPSAPALPLRVLALSGSLRRASFNSALLRAAHELAPEGVAIELYDYADVPLYDGDLDTAAHPPESVERLKAAIGHADALLIATPEYNHSIPGALKNVIDWASRPAFRSPLAGKPVAVTGVVTGSFGATVAQEHLKSILLATLAEVMPHRGVRVGHAGEKFDADLRLTDERTRTALAAFLRDFAAWTRQRVAAVPTEAV